VLGADSLLFRPGDVEACRDHVLDMLGDVSRTAAHTERVRARALDLFTSERSVSTWMDLYRQCLDTAARVPARQPDDADVRALGLAGNA
jgi:hypothetical protein